jgi:glycosyltransferase involved in cell wall biosynthesis
MRIGIYINNLWKISSTVKITYFLAKEFKKRGIEPIYLINREPIEIAQEFEIIKISAKGDIDRALKIGKIAKDLKLHAIYGFLRPQTVVLGLAKFVRPSLKVKLIGSVRNNDNYRSYNRWYHLPFRFLEKVLLERNDKIVAVSKAVKEDLIRAFFVNPDKIEVIYNPIDPDFVRRLAEEPIEEELQEIFQYPVIINVARMELQKGLHHLISIFERVNRELPQTRLVLIGDGSQRGRLENLVRQKGLKDKVFFLGWRQNPFKYVARSKVFAFTSLWEGFGLVLTEAMSLGIPIVAFNTKGGHAEVLEGCCPLIRYPDEENYARELIKLLTDQDYYRSLKTKVGERVKEFYPERVAQKYLKLAL